MTFGFPKIEPTDVPPETWRPLAHFFAALAQRFNDAAAAAERTEAERSALAARVAQVKDAGEMVAVYMMNGASADAAIAAVSQLTDVEPAALRVVLPKARRRFAEASRTGRDEQIRTLAKAGRSDAEIARELAKAGRPLHPKTINRVVNNRLTGVKATPLPVPA